MIKLNILSNNRAQYPRWCQSRLPMLIGAPNNNMPWVLYLLACNNGAYYAGITNDLAARFAAHLAGKGARYTRANPPIQILASKYYADRSSASIAEAQLKNLPRSKKLSFFIEWLFNEWFFKQ